MISSRYVLPAIFMVSLALVPTIIHSYMHARVNDGRETSSISKILAEMSSDKYTRHNNQWVKDMFDSDDWIERIYQTNDGHKIRLFVARSYDHKRLYHHPELGLSHGNDLKANGVTDLSGEHEIAVHLLGGSNGRGMVAYVLLYDGRFIREPLKHQIRDSFELLINPRRQMTLFYIDSPDSSVKQGLAGTVPATLLSAAISSYMSQ